MNNSSKYAWDRRVSQETSRLEERKRRRQAGLPVYSTEWTLAAAGKGFVAKRSGYCQICGSMAERGSTIRSVGRGRYAHWACVDQEIAKRKSPRGVVGVVARLSSATELRRRVFWSVECSTCGAAVGSGCLTVSGARRVRNHVERVLAYSKAKRERGVTADAEVLGQLRALAVKTVAASTRGERHFVEPVDPFEVELEWAVPMRT